MRDGHYIIGLTGGIACGKTSASDYLYELGFGVVDADVISRSITAPGGAALPEIREKFGDGVFHPDGTLDRAALGEIVFASTARRLELEAITHPAIQRIMLEEIRTCDRSIVVLSVPLLFETGLDVLCDEVWCLTVDKDTQIMRVMARDRLTREAAVNRVNSQMSPEKREERSDVLIRTDRDINDTRAQLMALAKDRMKRV